MTTPRAEIVAALEGLVPAGVKVLPYARRIDTPTADTVMVRTDEVAPARFTPTVRRTYTHTLVLVSPFQDDGMGPADEDLDALLEDVLHAVEAHPILMWSAARRGQWLDTQYPAYEITLEVPHEKQEPPA